MIESNSSRRRLLRAGWLTLLPLVLAGCGSKERATVEGKVTVDGAPANVGIVTFTSVDGKSRISAMKAGIQPDGTYRIEDAPLGEVKVSVAPLSLSQGRGAARRKERIKELVERRKGGKEMPGEPAPADSAVPIPKKYASADTSGLTTTLKPGKNVYDIELSSR
jgi:hypothetical protein